MSPGGKLAATLTALVLGASLFSPAAAPAQSGGVFVVGDSLEVGTSPNLGRYLPGVPITVDAVESRSSGDVLAALEQGLSDAHSIVVFDAGTNDDPAQPSALAANLAAAGELAGDRCLVVATINRPPYNGVSADGLNAAVVAFVAGRPNTRIVDWRTAALSDPGLLYDDGVHPTPAGYDLRARLIADGIRECTAATTPVPPPPAPEPAPRPRLSAAERLDRARAATAGLLGGLLVTRVEKLFTGDPAAILMLALTLLGPDPAGNRPASR